LPFNGLLCKDLTTYIGRVKKIILLFFSLLSNLLVAQTFLSGFSRVQVGSSISSPTVMAFAPDGRIFVAQQSGALRVIKNGTLLTTPFVSITVNSSGERGLIGVALDPDFATNNFIYLYYTTNTAPIHNRIVRYTANGDVALAGSEQLILDLDNLSGATNHNGGALGFGLDGKLYVAVGDNATGSNAQNLDTYHGKLLRINKDGSAPTDNPFFSAGASEQRKRVWAYGLRNPYTFSVQPVTGKIYVNDVGQSSVEEINDATLGGRNFGWPTAEGNSANAAFTNPVFAYNHSGSAPTGCAITGGTFFNPSFTSYPASYIGNFFYQDYCSNWIYSLNLSGTPTTTLFASNVGGSSVSLTTGTDGNLYYLSRSSSALYKIISSNVSVPVINTHPASSSKSEGTAVTFSVSASGTAPLQYQWQKNEVAIPNATQSTYAISNLTLSDAGTYRVVVTNTAGQAISNNATLTVVANTKPVAHIISPEENATYIAGTTISFSGSGADTEDGALAAVAMSWQINFHHDTHKHDEPLRNGVSEGTFEIPDQGETSANVWYRIILSVTDSKGSVGKDSVDLLPQKSFLNFVTDPLGLQVTIDGQPKTAPISIESVVGIKREIGTYRLQTSDNVVYEFSNWLHGGDVIQLLATPDNDITYTAVFNPVLGAEHIETTFYPNPAKDQLYIPHRNLSSITITDLIGRSWRLSSERANESTIVDVTTLPVGIYMLSFYSDQTLFRHKLLIQR
jgi:glucose/arabinose dehydrogenase